MVQWARFLRSWFGVQALVLGSIFAYTLYRLTTQFQTGTLPSRFQPGTEIILLAVPCAGVVTATAWWKLRRGLPSAWLWAMAASIMNLPMGLGTISGMAGLAGTLAGVGGLFVFSRRDIAQKMAEENARQRAMEQARTGGDGTSKWLERLGVVGQVLFFFAGKALWDIWRQTNQLPQPHRFFWIALYEIALLAAIFCHEAGHVCAGWLMRMKTRKFVVGPFEWMVRGGKWRFRFHLSGLMGRGETGMVPVEMDHLEGRTIFMLLGGPMGSLLAASLAALGAISAKGQPWEPAWEFLSILATIGAGQFLINLIPMAPESNYSDGAQIFQLASRAPWAQVHMAFSMVGSTTVTGRRPRDYDIELLERAARFLTHGHKAVLLRLYACFHFLDCGNRENALAALRGAESVCPEELVEPSLCAELAFLNALFRQDSARARMWWERMLQGGQPSVLRTEYWRARAALEWTEGSANEAFVAWEKGAALAQSLPKAGAYEFDRWCFEQLRIALGAEPAFGLAALHESVGQTVDIQAPIEAAR